MAMLFAVVLPVFGLVGAGWLARRAAWLGAGAAVEMNRFVVHLAMPALLFQIMSRATWREMDMPGFIGAFGLASAAIFFVAVAVRRLCGGALADASLEGLNAAYANLGFIGFPLCVAAFGASSMAPVTIAAILTVCVLFAIALAVLEFGLGTGDTAAIFIKVCRSLTKNPMLVAPVLGGLYACAGPVMPTGAEHFLTLLASAASPCALVSLGLFLAEPRPRPDLVSLGVQVGLKLIGQPLLTWLLAHRVFHLQPTLTAIAVILAALPTGTGPFILANLYGREADNVASSVLFSTVVSVFTITMLLAWFCGTV